MFNATQTAALAEIHRMAQNAVVANTEVLQEFAKRLATAQRLIALVLAQRPHLEQPEPGLREASCEGLMKEYVRKQIRGIRSGGVGNDGHSALTSSEAAQAFAQGLHDQMAELTENLREAWTAVVQEEEFKK